MIELKLICRHDKANHHRTEVSCSSINHLIRLTLLEKEEKRNRLITRWSDALDHPYSLQLGWRQVIEYRWVFCWLKKTNSFFLFVLLLLMLQMTSKFYHWLRLALVDVVPSKVFAQQTDQRQICPLVYLKFWLIFKRDLFVRHLRSTRSVHDQSRTFNKHRVIVESIAIIFFRPKKYYFLAFLQSTDDSTIVQNKNIDSSPYFHPSDWNKQRISCLDSTDDDFEINIGIYRLIER